MGMTSVRDALIGALTTWWAANYAAVPIEFENAVSPDLDSVGNIYVRVVIDFLDAAQVDMADLPRDRLWGEVRFDVMLREGEGSRTALVLMDDLFDFFKRQVLPGVTCRVPKPLPNEPHDGWANKRLHVPFYTEVIS